MDILQDMRVFVRVVEAGSFTLAAQQMRTTTAQTSRAVSELEVHLRARLLNRTTRRLALTEAGERYLHRCEAILAYVEQAEAEASDAQMRPSGRLRVHSMSSFGQHYVVPAIAKYRERYPAVSFELTLSQRVPDLLEEGYDVSVTLANELEDSGLIAQPLGHIYSILCASPGYLAKRGTPRKPADLLEHSCLQLITPITPSHRWIMEGPDGTETIDLPPALFTVNQAEAMASALDADMGIGILPSPSALPRLRDGSLIQVLPEYRILLLGIWALYASRQYLDAKIKTWIEFLRETLPATLAADEGALTAFVK